MNYEDILIASIGYLFLALCLAAFAVWVSHTSGCHSAKFYDKEDKP